MAQHVGQAVREIVVVEAVFIGSAEDRQGCIVSRNDDKRVVTVEDIKGRLAAFCHLSVGQRQCADLLGVVALQVLHAYTLRAVHVDGRSDDLAHKQGQSHQSK